MMQKLRRLLAAEQARELHLAAGRRQQIVAADHQGDALHQVVDSRSELVAPVAVAIADQQVAALFGRSLFLWTVPQIDEPLDALRQVYAQPATGAFRQA